ncbi:MAG: hypothetical protein GY859_14670, partial [Desulfobacterales bacterium]|nr:hypothetical protein [Desulfobacterales bacterium]
MSEKREKSQEDYDWDNRVLCSDGNCIGVIGRDGRCKECGIEYDGELHWEKSEKTDGEEDAPE